MGARGDWSRVDAKVRATLADERLDGSADVDAPFGVLAAAFHVPVAATTPGAPLDASVDVTRLDLGELMRGGLAAGAPIDGRLAMHLKVGGSADKPTLDLQATGDGLKVGRAPSRGAADKPAELGQATLHATYAERAAHAELTFAAARGGSLHADAGAAVDLGYPQVAHGPSLKRVPVHGQVVARSLDTAWLARFNPRVESLGGRVSANAKLAGTLSDPRFIGDVRWKDGGATLSQATGANFR